MKKKLYKRFLGVITLCMSMFVAANSWGITQEEWDSFVTQLNNAPDALTIGEPSKEQWETLMDAIQLFFNSNEEPLHENATTINLDLTNLTNPIYTINPRQFYNFLVKTINAANNQAIFIKTLLDNYQILLAISLNTYIQNEQVMRLFDITRTGPVIRHKIVRTAYTHIPYIGYVREDFLPSCCCFLQ